MFYFAFKFWEIVPADQYVSAIQDTFFDGVIPFVGFLLAGYAGFIVIKAFKGG
jgi:hypothetical protein